MSFSLAPATPLRWFVPAQNGTGLVPADGYFYKFFEAGLGTGFPKNVYTDAIGTPFPAPSNTVELNSEGYAVAYLGPGAYAAQITDPNGAQIAYIDPYVGGGGSGGVGFAALDTIIATDDPASNGLAQLNTTLNQIVYCAGYHAINDGGGGMFYNIASGEAEDGGYCFASTFDTNKRWFRIPEDKGIVKAESFGYIGTTSGDQSDAFMAADGYCAANNLTLKVGPGSAAKITNIFGTIDLYSPEIAFEAGSKLTAKLGTESIVFLGVISGTLEQHLKDFVSITWSNPPAAVPQELYPQWLGAIEGNNAFDNTGIFGLCASSGAPVVRVSGGKWYFDSAYVLPVTATQIWKVDGFGRRFNETVIFKPGNYTDLFTFGKDIKITGQAKGDLSVEQDMLAGGNAQASIDVVAGRHLLATAGTGTKQFAAGGRLFTYSDTTGISTSGTGAVNLVAYTLPANSCPIDLDSLVIKGSGNATSPGTAIIIVVKVGTAEVLFITLKGNGTGYFHFEVNVTRLGAIAASGEGIAVLSPTADFNSIGAFFSSAVACDWSLAQSIQVIGQCNSGSITQHTMTVDFLPAPI